MLNRSVLPITSTLVAPELTVEPRDVREYGHSASRDSSTSNLFYNSLLSLILVKYSSKFKCTWIITGIPCYRMIRSGILVLPCPYLRMMSLGILLLMLGLTCLSSVIPSWICSLNLSTYFLEKTPTFSSSEIDVFLYSFCLQPITFPVYGIINWCPMCRLLRISDSAKLPFGDSGYLYVYIYYTHLWDVYTIFGITRDGTCDQIL